MGGMGWGFRHLWLLLPERKYQNFFLVNLIQDTPLLEFQSLHTHEIV